MTQLDVTKLSRENIRKIYSALDVVNEALELNADNAELLIPHGNFEEVGLKLSEVRAVLRTIEKIEPGTMVYIDRKRPVPEPKNKWPVFGLSEQNTVSMTVDRHGFVVEPQMTDDEREKYEVEKKTFEETYATNLNIRVPDREGFSKLLETIKAENIKRGGYPVGAPRNEKDKESIGKTRLISRDARGIFYYDGKPIEIPNKEAKYSRVLEVLFEHGDLNEGFCPYEVIEKKLQQLGEPAVMDKKKMVERIANAITNLRRYSTLPKKAPDGKGIIKTRRGKGIVFYNPSLN